MTRNLVPAPIVADSGLKEKLVATGSIIVNVLEPEVPPPGVELKIVTEDVPALAMFNAGTVALKVDVETYVVAKSEPFHPITELGTKFDPTAVSTKSDPPAKVEVGETEFKTGTGLLMVKLAPINVIE
jgi:hypothetical protein